MEGKTVKGFLQDMAALVAAISFVLAVSSWATIITSGIGQ